VFKTLSISNIKCGAEKSCSQTVWFGMDPQHSTIFYVLLRK